MPGVGDPLAAEFFGSAGDIRRFKNSKALVAYAGIDSPPDESGDFSSTHRHITKKGSKVFRDTGYESNNDGFKGSEENMGKGQEKS